MLFEPLQVCVVYHYAEFCIYHLTLFAQTSSIDRSHHDPVYDVFWIQSKTNNQFASVSTDGCMLWWDTRKLTEPTDTLQLQVRPDTTDASIH
jgi:hypothetical protein